MRRRPNVFYDMDRLIHRELQRIKAVANFWWDCTPDLDKIDWRWPRRGI